MAITITDSFGIGYRCTSDDFMKGLNIRKYSSPFSYMICDLETSIQFIIDKFQDFLNVTLKQNHKFTWNGRLWDNKLFFNNSFIPEKDDLEINKIKRMCVWNHHDLNNTTILDSIKRRCLHLLNADNFSNVLYIYIDNIRTYHSDNWEDYFPKELILNFISTKNRHILLLLPLLNFNTDPVLYNINTQLNVIFYESNMDGDTNNYNNSKIKWNIINKLVLEKYSFDIKVKLTAEI
jgi:hypothetical protein